MKPPLWILALAMISNPVSWAQEQSKVLVDDRRKSSVPTEPHGFTLRTSAAALTPRMARESLTTFHPRPLSMELRKSAEAGSVAAQASLANLYLTEGADQPKSFELAYQWALIAQANGDARSRHVLRELDLYLTPLQVSDARKRAETFLKKQQEAKK